MVQLVVSIVLYFVMFFGISFILNMLLRQTWLMAFVYPVIIILIVDDFAFSKYFTNPGDAFSQLWNRMVNLTYADILILASGFIGTIVSGIVIQKLRKSGYQMF